MPAAARHFRRAAELKPDWVLALTTAAWVLSTSASPDVRAPADAVELAERASGLTGRQDARSLDVLAVALASAGRFDDAVRTAREALGKAAPPLSGGDRRADCAVRARRAVRGPEATVGGIDGVASRLASTP